MNVRLLIGFLFASALCSLVEAQETTTPPTPLGLTFGSSKSQVKSLGVVLSEEKDGALGAEAVARNLPKALSDTGPVLLMFGFDDQLFRVIAMSNSTPHDETAYRGKERFNEISSMLSERYGQGKDLSYAPTDSWYAAPDKFAYSISQNKRQHARQWTVGRVMISLRLGSSHSDTFYILVYEDTVRAANAKKGQRGREKEAL